MLIFELLLFLWLWWRPMPALLSLLHRITILCPVRFAAEMMGRNRLLGAVPNAHAAAPAAMMNETKRIRFWPAASTMIGDGDAATI
jgi:hypothetical protein